MPTIEIIENESGDRSILVDVQSIPPGLYRLVSEEKIEDMWKTFDGLPRLAAAHLDAINAAGLGRKETK